MTTKVLLIDDDEDDFLITRDLLEEIPNRSYSLDWISVYDEGLDLISELKHDIYLIDYRLGSYDGLQLISEALRRGYKAPFILLTGQGSMETDEKAMKVGAVDFLVKGAFSPSELERSIRYSIVHHRNIEEIQTLNHKLEQRVEERTLELAATVKKLENSNLNLQDQVRERKIVEEALRESQNLYSTIAHNFPNGVISVIDRDMHFVFTDGKELDSLRLKAENVVGRHVKDVLQDEHAVSYIIDQYQKVFNGEVLNFDVAVFNRQYVFHAAPLPDTSDEIHQILVVAENITERKKAEEEIRRALEKEKELNELKSRFVTMASHEFRTPLSTILSSSTLISKYGESQQQGKRLKHVNRIKSNVKHLNRLLNDFLSLGKLEEGKISNSPEYFEADELCQAVLEEIELMAEKNQRIHLKVNGKPRKVYLDKQLLKNILINLLSNAIKYSPDGKDVDLELHYRETAFKIKVVDQGIGIPEPEQEHLFERFFRAKNTTNIQGTGLGLNIVKKYVDLMDGSIEFYSKLNAGTTVITTFETESVSS